MVALFQLMQKKKQRWEKVRLDVVGEMEGRWSAFKELEEEVWGTRRIRRLV